MEEVRLVKLVLKKIEVIENKKTDATSSRQKKEAWEAVAEEFNESSYNSDRTAKVLKEKYSNLKKSISRGKREKRQSSDGVPTKKDTSEHHNDVLDELSVMLDVDVEALPPRYEDESVEGTNACGENTKKPIEFLGFEMINEDAGMSSSIDEEGTASSIDCTTQNTSMVRSKEYDLLHSTNHYEETTTDDLITLKKKFLLQQLKYARLEHEQRMLHSREEHKLKMRILKTELKLKQFKNNKC